MTKSSWSQLTPKQQWDTIVALRGPDIHSSDTIKHFTTSVIRGEMAPIMRVGGSVNTDLKAIVVPAGWQRGTRKNWPDDVPKVFQSNLYHFFQHVIEAARVLGVEIIHITSEEKYWEAMNCHDVYHAAALLLKAIKDQQTDRYPHCTPEALKVVTDYLTPYAETYERSLTMVSKW